MTKERLDLTGRQAEVLAFIKANMAFYSPSCREIAKAIGAKSPNAATAHLDALEKKGWITRDPGKARNIKVLA